MHGPRRQTDYRQKHSLQRYLLCYFFAYCVNLQAFLSYVDFFQNSFFLKKFFQKYHQCSVLNRFDPDQARHFVGPNLGPNYLRRL